jgi:hypothetical protein
MAGHAPEFTNRSGIFGWTKRIHLIDALNLPIPQNRRYPWIVLNM